MAPILVLSTTGTAFRLTVGLKSLPLDAIGLLNDTGAGTSGIFWATTTAFWGGLGADTVAAVGLIASAVVLKWGLGSSMDLGDAD